MTDFVYMTAREADGVMDDVVIAVNADVPDANTVEVGVSTGDDHEWHRFQSGAKPAVRQDGKTVIPFRVYSKDGKAAKETLIRMDGYVFKARYGRWNPASAIAVFTSSGEEVSVDRYQVFPDAGLIVFRERTTGTYHLSVTDTAKVKTAIKVTSRDPSSATNIRAAGVMYTKK
jgi:hypothetical protein